MLICSTQQSCFVNLNWNWSLWRIESISEILSEYNIFFAFWRKKLWLKIYFGTYYYKHSNKTDAWYNNFQIDNHAVYDHSFILDCEMHNSTRDDTKKGKWIAPYLHCGSYYWWHHTGSQCTVLQNECNTQCSNDCMILCGRFYFWSRWTT